MRLYTNYILGTCQRGECPQDSSFKTKISPRYGEDIIKKFSKFDWFSNTSIWEDLSHSSLRISSFELEEEGDYEEYEYYLSGIISNFFGNCGICSISAPDLNYGEDRDKQFFDFLIALCLQMGYTQVLYSVSTNQLNTIKLITKRGFKSLQETLVTNLRSGNDIQIYYLNIK